MDDREFEESNELSQKQFLYQNLKKLTLAHKEEVLARKALEAQVTAIVAAGALDAFQRPGAEVRPSISPGLRRKEIQTQYPAFTSKCIIGVFEKHIAVLGHKPTDDQLKSTFEKTQPYPLRVKLFMQRLGCTEKEAAAWLYLLRKKGWIDYCQVTWTYENKLE